MTYPRTPIVATQAARGSSPASVFSRKSISIAVATALGASPGFLFANTINPDMRTDTTVTVNGTISDITTSTVRGANAFNSFTDFTVTNGNTVNLHLPDATDNLINLVTDSRAVIDGTLNSIKSGRIGGNVVFADPHGIVVGATGILNVGSLLLVAPTQGFMDDLMDENGVIDEDRVTQLLIGNAALGEGADALIQMDGTVNAFGAVALEGRGVVLTGEIQSGTDKAHAELFNAAVNTDGIEAGEDVVVVDGRITIRSAEDVQITGVADASSAETGGRAGRVDIQADGAVNIAASARVAAVGAADGGGGGRIDVDAAGNVSIEGELDVSGNRTVAASGNGKGGTIELHSDQDLDVAASASLAAAGAQPGGDGGRIGLDADGTVSLSGTTELDVSAGDTGDGGQIEVSGTGADLDGLNADLAGGSGGIDGELLVGSLDVTMGSTAYYTNGGDVLINAGDSLTIKANARINTRRIDDSKDAVAITPASPGSENPAALDDAAAADLFTTASEGHSGNVTLQAPNITVESGATIYTFATDGYDGGDISLISGDNFTCNICEATEPGDYFSSVDNVGNTARIASTDDVSISVADGAVLDARYVDRAGYDGAAGSGGNIELSAEASDLQVAGWSNADASITVNGILRAADISVQATADAGVDFAWLAALDPANPTGALTAMEEVSSTDFDQIHQNIIENGDDPGDLSNLLGVGLPITAGLAIANARVVIGDGAELDAAGELNINALASREVTGASGGLAAASLTPIGIGAIYGQVSGETSVVVSGDASLTGQSITVNAESNNQMEVVAEAEVATAKRTGTSAPKGNQTAAFALAIGRAAVTTEAIVGESVTIAGVDADGPAVTVRAHAVDSFATEASSVALADPKAQAQSQGAMTVAFADYRTSTDAQFNASAALESLDVVADNLSSARLTKATVQNGNNAFDYLLGSKKQRKGALDALIGGAYTRSGTGADFRFAAAASVSLSDQSATASIGPGAIITAENDVTVRSRVVNQGIRNIADSRVNSSAGSDGAKTSGSVAIAFGTYDHSSHALIGDGADITAANIGVGARSELPIDNDYDEAFSDLDPTNWDGPQDFFGALDSIIGSALEPDVVALESFGLADFLLTSYANAYGTAEENAIFGTVNATIARQDTRAWVGEGAQLTATGAGESWTSEFGITVEPPEGEDDHDLDTDTEWEWSAGVDVDARNRTETISVTGNLSLLTLLTSRKDPAGTSVGGSFGWTEFDTSTIAGIGDGAVVRAASLDVQAEASDLMYIIAPSAGQGDSIAGNGIFSLAQVDSVTRGSVHHGAHVDSDHVGIFADHDVNLWSIGGAVAVSSETSVAAAIAVNSITSDTRAYIGNNSEDRVLEEGEDRNNPADVAVADGSDAGVRTEALDVAARSSGSVGAIGVAGAVARDNGTSNSSPPAPPAPPTPPTPGDGSFLTALQAAGQAVGGGGSAPGGTATLSGSGSGTLNISGINTIAEVREASLLNGAGDAAPDLNISALSSVDQISASGAAAVSIAGGSGGRSAAIAGAIAFNDIDNETRAGLYDFNAPNGGTVGNVNVLSATSGDAMSTALALAVASGSGPTGGGAGSVSIAVIDADSTAEIVDSELTADSDENTTKVTGYDRSRILAGGGALYLGAGGGSGGGVGLAATYGRVDNDVSAFIRGSQLNGFNTVDVSALGASRILAGAFGGAASSGNSFAGAGSLYMMTLDSDLQAGIVASYDNAGAVEKRSEVETEGDVTVQAKSSEGVAEIESQLQAGGLDGQADFDGNVLSQIDPDLGIVDDTALAGEAVLGLSGALALSGGNAAAGFAVGFTDLQGSYVAQILDSDVTASAGDVDVSAINSRQAIGLAGGASVSGGGGVTLLGSAAITLSDTLVKAEVAGDSNITAEEVSVNAAAQGSIYSLAGSLTASASGTAALGAAATYNEIGGDVTAHLGGNRITTTGTNPVGEDRSVNVTADQDADIRSVAITGSFGGGQVAAAGSATINVLSTDTSALLDATEVNSDSVGVSVINGTEANKVGVWSLAGSIVGGANAGAGAAVAVNTLQANYDAKVQNTEFTNTDELSVTSEGASEVKTLAVSAGAAGNVSLGVSNATNTIGNTVSARLDDATIDNDNARIDVSAADRSSIDSLAGAVQGGGTAAFGISTAVNSIDNTIDSGVSGGNLGIQNLSIEALTQADIQTIAVGAAVGGTAAVAGSIAVNVLDTRTTAAIDGDADVEAQHNVGVVAASKDTIDVYGGGVGVGVGAVGGGISEVVNYINSVTSASISGAGTRVSALALDPVDTLTVASGDLVEVPDVQRLEEAADFEPVNLQSQSKTVTGVAVNAQSQQSIGTLATTVGANVQVGGVAGAVTATTNIAGGTTSAFVKDSSINKAAGAGAAQQLDVTASSHAYTGNIALGLAAGGGASGTATIAADVISRNTEAYLSGADVSALDSVGVYSRTILGTSLLSAGGAGGVVAAAGSGAFVLHDATTLAYLEGGTDVEADRLSVDAEADNAMLLSAGAVAVGGGAAAGALNLGISSLTTEAAIDGGYRDPADGSGDVAELRVTGDIDVSVDSNTSITDYAIGGAGGGSVGLAGSILVNVMENRTIARVKDADIGGPGAGGDISIRAQDESVISAFSGAAGGGGTAGIGAGAHVSIVHGTVAATLENSDVQTTGALTVNANASTEVDAISVAAGAGGSAGISGAVSVSIIGSGERGDANEEIDKDGEGTLSGAADLASADRTGNLTGSDKDGNSVDLVNVDQKAGINASGTYDLVAGTDESLDDTTSALINGGSIEAGSVSVEADDKTHLASLSGAAAVGTVGAGGAVVVDRVYNTVSAGIIDDAQIISAGDVLVTAQARDGNGSAVDASAYAGAAGLVGLGAAFVDARIDNDVSVTVDARIQDTRNTSAADLSGNRLTMTAEDTTSVDVEAVGAAAGAAAAGIVVANAGKTSVVDARIVNASLLDDRQVDIRALAMGAVSSNSIAAAGGVFAAASGSIATAIDSAQISAGVYNSNLIVNGTGLQIDALATPETSAEAFGVSVSGYASVGASVATAQADSTVNAVIGNGTTIEGSGSVGLRARADKAAADAQTANATATGAAGGAGLIGANATVTDAFSNTDVTAKVESGATLNTSGSTTISARNISNQLSDADSYAVGLVAMGGNVSTAKSEGSTTAVFEGGLGHAESARRGLSVSAVGEAINRARAEAGGGGVIAGAASDAYTVDNSEVTAILGSDGMLQVANLNLEAEHTSNFNTRVDSTQASIAGMSGAWGSNQANVFVTAEVRDDAAVRADNIAISAFGIGIKEDEGYSVVSGSGGAFNAAAARTITDLNLTTVADIGDRADLAVTGDWRDPGLFTVAAENRLDLFDSVKLDAGGAIAIANAVSNLISDVSATVNVGTDAVLDTVGELVLGTRTQADTEAKANSKTYGLAGSAAGTTRNVVTADHVINIGEGADLQAYGNTRLHSGRDANGAQSTFELSARTDFWNNTAFPVNNRPVADAVLTQTGSITIADSARVASVADVFLIADKGSRELTGKGVGKDLYSQAAEGIANAFGSLVGAGEVSLEINDGSTSDTANTTVTVDGTVAAGIFNDQFLELDYTALPGGDGSVAEFDIDEIRKSEGVNYRVLEEFYSQTLLERLDALYSKLSNYSASPIEAAAFQSEINLLEGQLEALGRQAGLTNEQLYPNGTDGQIVVPSSFPIFVVEVDDVIARPGNIDIIADVLKGSGVLDAPGDASIEIINNSPAFLRTRGLTIPDRDGGRVRFNNSRVTSNAEIAALNPGNEAPSFAAIKTADTSPEPTITVENRFNPQDLDGTLPPDIFVTGDVENRRGRVEIVSNQGSVLIDGDVRANETVIGAGENVVLSYIDSFRHIGTDPSGLVDPDPDAVTIAGNSIVISARYINVNGLIQSGIADWSVDIDDTHLAAINIARTNYQLNGGDPLVRIRESEPVNGTIGYRYDFDNERIVLDAVDVSGGYMELTGKIMSTGAGELRALDGYGRVRINNTTDLTMDIAGINLGNEIEGRIRINDAGLLDGNDDNLTSTIYTRVGDSVQVYRGAFSDVDTTAEFLDSSLTDASGNRSSVYNPRANLDFIWLDAQAVENVNIIERYSDVAIGIFDAGSGTEARNETFTDGDPRTVEGSEYLTEGSIPVAQRDDGTYNWGVESYETDEANATTTSYSWSECVSHFVVCLERRYWVRDTKRFGSIDISRRGTAADQAVAVSFIGNDSGDARINSLGDLLLSGSVLNESGATRIDGRSLDALNDDVLIEARELTLGADNGIGMTGALRVAVKNNIEAVTIAGDLNISGISGDLNITNATTENGDIHISAQDNILRVGEGVIRGSAINLESRQGSIGSASVAVNIDTGNRETSVLDARGPQGVYLNEASGDLRIRSIDAGASDVTLVANKGALLDANTTEAIDERLDEEIQNLWDGMELTGAGAEDALAREQEVQERAGQTRYERYWQLRETVAETDSEGNTTFSSADYDENFEATYSDDQVSALTKAYGWETEEEINAGVADLQQRRIQEYQELHSEFADTVAFDPDYQFELDQATREQIAQGAVWTEEQLTSSIAQGLAGAPGADTGIVNEEANIIGRNIRLEAMNIGRTLDETLLIDLSEGVRSLTDQERRALSTAEFDDVSVDPDAPQVITIVQRDDLDIIASGHVTATADESLFIGGEQDLNLYNVAGETVRLQTNGSVTTARNGATVLTADDVIIEGSDGSIGKADALLGTAISGELTARTNGGIFLNQNGDLALNRLLGLGGVDLRVAGNLTAARNLGETITGSAVNLDVSGAVGSETNRVNVIHGLGDQLAVNAGGDAWLGAQQGAALTASNLVLGDVDVDGRLDIANVRDLIQTGATQTGGLSLNLLGQWEIAETGSIDSSGSVVADVAGSATLRNVAVTDESEDAFVLGAFTINAPGDGDHLKVAGGVDLDTTTDIASAASPLRLAASRVEATSLEGDIYLHLLKDTPNGGGISAIEGEILLTGDDSITLDRVFAQNQFQVKDLPGALTVDDLYAFRIDVTAGAAAIEAGRANTEIDIETTGNQDHGVVRADDLVRLVAGGEIRFDELYAGPDGAPLGTQGDVRLDAGGDVIGNQIKANRDIGIGTLGSMIVENVARGGALLLEAGRNLFARVGGDITDTTVQAGNDVELIAEGVQEGTSGDIQLNSVTAGGKVTLTAAGGIVILSENGVGGFIDSGATVALKAGGNIDVSNVIAGSAVTATGAGLTFGNIESGGEVTLDAAQNLSVQTISSNGLQSLDAGGDITFGTLDAGGAIASNSGGKTQGDEIVGGTTVELTAEDINVQTITAGGRVSASGAGLTFGNIGSGGDVTLDAAQNLSVQTISSNGLQSLNAGGDFTFGMLDAGGAIASNSGGNTQGDEIVGGTTVELIAEDINVQTITAGDSVSASGAGLTFGNIESGADVSMDALQNFFVLTVDSLGHQILDVRGNVDFERLTAGESITSVSGGNTQGGEASSKTEIAMTAGMIWNQAGEAAGILRPDTDLVLDEASAPRVRLRSSGRTAVGLLTAAEIATLWGNDISANVRGTSDGTLQMAFNGGNGGLSDQVDLNITSDGNLLFDTAYARNAKVHTSSSNLIFDDAWITELLTVKTPETNLRVDQLNPGAQKVDVQLYELDDRFRLEMNGRDIWTDAYVVRYNSGFTVTVPNFQLDHDLSGVEVGGESAENKVSRIIENGRRLPDSFGQGRGLVFPSEPSQAPVDGGVETAPVNLTTDMTNNDQGEDDDVKPNA